MGTRAVERLVNLAMYLASSTRSVSAAEVRSHVGGYASGSGPAFSRMFERDKEDLRDAGLMITVDRSEDVERYHLDAAATFAETVELEPLEAMQLRAAAAAMMADPSFPFTEDLRPALAKMVAASDMRLGAVTGLVSALSADEEPVAQGSVISALMGAVTGRKIVRFRYRDAAGRGSDREVEPWGLFARDGRWYLVGNDRDAGGVRVFAAPRIKALEIGRGRPKTPDFERPAGFDVRRWMVMPFQFGPQTMTAEVHLTGPAAARASALTAGQGKLRALEDGGIAWELPLADATLFARWVIANGPGIEVLTPPEVEEALSAGLAKVVADHG